jgi:tripartite-type tricarboxylate transporter receptor subunit TctC
VGPTSDNGEHLWCRNDGGSAQVAKSRADGYTLLVGTSAWHTARLIEEPAIRPAEGFHPGRSLTSQPCAGCSQAGWHLYISETIAAAKAKPNLLKFSSTGMGTGSHWGLAHAGGARGRCMCPWDRAKNRRHDPNTVAGHTDYMLAPIQLALVDIRAGRLCPPRAVVRKRSPLPEVLTIAEAGVEISAIRFGMACGRARNSCRSGEQTGEVHRAR